MKLYSWKDYDPFDVLTLGCALGTFFGKDKVVGIGRDGKPVCRFVRRDLISGLALTGTTTFDVRLVPSVALRHVIREQEIDGGLYVSYYDGEIHVHLYNSHGEDASIEMVEEILRIKEGKKFLRVGLEDLGTTTYYPNAIEDFVKCVHEKIRFRRELRILVDCLGDPIALAVERLLRPYGIDAVLLNAFISGYAKTPSEDFFLKNFIDGNFSYGLRIEREDSRGMWVYTKTQRLHANDWIETLSLLQRL